MLPPPSGARHRHGATLPELMATLAIMALLLALGAPVLSGQRAGAEVRGAATQVLGALHLARRMALATGRTMTVCPTRDGIQCGFGGREWMLFANGAGGVASRREAGEELLRRWRLPERVQVSGTRGHAAFLPQTSAATTLTFEFCHPADPQLRRTLVVSQTGRPRLSRPDRPSTPPRSQCP